MISMSNVERFMQDCVNQQIRVGQLMREDAQKSRNRDLAFLGLLREHVIAKIYANEIAKLAVFRHTQQVLPSAETIITELKKKFSNENGDLRTLVDSLKLSLYFEQCLKFAKDEIDRIVSFTRNPAAYVFS